MNVLFTGIRFLGLFPECKCIPQIPPFLPSLYGPNSNLVEDEEELFAAQLAKFVADDPSLLSGFLFGAPDSDNSSIHQPQQSTSSAPMEEDTKLDPTGLLALSLLFDGMANTEEQPCTSMDATLQHRIAGQQHHLHNGALMDPRQEQQNIDFEEVSPSTFTGTFVIQLCVF